jgi:sugar phosphate isomerase/epimerase
MRARHRHPLYAVNEWSTPHNDVFDDIEQIARTGGSGIGLYEGKIPRGRDETVREAMAVNGLRATFCVPQVWTILPVPFNTPDSQRDPKVRTDLICESLPRLRAFDPEAIVIGPGTSGDPTRPVGPVEAVEEGLAQVADAAAELDLAVAFELLAERRGSPLHTLPSIVEFIDRVGRSNVGVMFDVFHSWCEPDLHAHLREYANRIIGVHVNDIRLEERSGFDRELPGDGRGVCAEIMATLMEAGYDSWWELEVFSDDGTFGNAFPDSLWAIPHEEFLARAKEAFDRTQAKAIELLESRPATIRAEAER